MAKSKLERAAELARHGRLAEAESCCREVLRSNPSNVPALRLLGRILRGARNPDQSVRVLRQLASSRPHDAQTAAELGASLVAAGRPADGLPHLHRAIESMPREPEWRRWLGKAHLQAFRPGAAVAELLQASVLDPESEETSLLLANAYLAGGRPRRALPILRGLSPNHQEAAPVRLAMAQAQEQMGDPSAAFRSYEDALAGDASGLALAGCVRCLLAEGRLEAALSTARQAHEASPTVHTFLGLARAHLALRRPLEAMPLLEEALAIPAIQKTVEVAIWFALGDARDQARDFSPAFEAYTHANSLYPRTFRAERLAARHRAWREVVHENLRSRPRLPAADGSNCVFILGMPRSGTTLVEQILDCHPMVHGCGELPTLGLALREIGEELGGPYPDCLSGTSDDRLARAAADYLEQLGERGPGADRLTDKLPHNFELLGVIDRLLSGARVIHCVRHPVDTCLSCYFTQLSPRHDYATDLGNLGQAYGAYTRLMRHWKASLEIPILDVRYEEVVTDPEGQARRLIEFVGLPWHDACLEPWKNGRVVATASTEQVRQPIYTSSLRRFRRYQGHLGPLVTSLAEEGVSTA
ncbi:MAG: sulfotransferase [Phycisphaerales bacterium]|nr:sulfotransferase [Phycisphaerales bacterium]